MLLYYLFWMFMGFILHFYIIFGTNLLTQSPVPVPVFFPCFSVSKKRNIKRSPNGMKPSGELFLERKQSRRLGVYVREATRKARGRGRAHPPWARPPSLWPPHGSSDFISKSPGFLLVQEKSSRRFHSVWTPFSIPFLRDSKLGEKTGTSTGL